MWWISKSIKKKKINGNIKDDLLKFVRENNEVEEIEINIANVTNPRVELRMINCYEKLRKNKHKRLILYETKQGEIFFKNAKESRATLHFKISLYKSLIKYPKLRNSALAWIFSRNIFKSIKSICKQYPISFS